MPASKALTKGDKAFYTFLRYAVSLAMLFYGFAKLENAQFTVLDSELDKPLSQVSGFWLTWYYFSYSAFYGSIIALFQIACAFLLMSRRTTLLAAVLLLPVMTNIVLIDFFFGIGEGIFPAMLVFAAVAMLIAFHWQELLNLFWYSQAARLASQEAAASGRSKVSWIIRFSMVFGSALLLYYVANYNNRSPTPLDGVWQIMNVVPPDSEDPYKIPSVIYFEYNRVHLCVFQMQDGSFSRWHDFSVKPQIRRLIISEEWRHLLSQDQNQFVLFAGTYKLQRDVLLLSGAFSGKNLRRTLQ